MKAIITVKCENGEAKIPCFTLAALGELTASFDKTGVEYEIQYKKCEVKAA